MKMLRVVVRLILPGLLLLGVAAAISFASFQAGLNARCKTGNLKAFLTSEQKEQADAFWMAWTTHARVCTVGRYQVAVPANDPPIESVFMYQKDRLFLIATSPETELFDDTGK